MQQLTGDRDNLKTKNALLLQFVRGLTLDLNDCQSSQKKYKVNVDHSSSVFSFYSMISSCSKHIRSNNSFCSLN